MLFSNLYGKYRRLRWSLKTLGSRVRPVVLVKSSDAGIKEPLEWMLDRNQAINGLKSPFGMPALMAGLAWLAAWKI